MRQLQKRGGLLSRFRFRSLHPGAVLALLVLVSLPIAGIAAVVSKRAVERLLGLPGGTELRGGALDMLGGQKAGDWAFAFVLWAVTCAAAGVVAARRLDGASADGEVHSVDERRYERSLTIALALPPVVSVVTVVALLGSHKSVDVGSLLALALCLQVPVVVMEAARRRALEPGAAVRRPSAEVPWIAMALPLGALGLVVAIRYAAVPATVPVSVAAGLAVALVLVVAVVLGVSSARRESAPDVRAWWWASCAAAAAPLVLPPLLRGAGATTTVPGSDRAVLALVVGVVVLLVVAETALRVRYRVRSRVASFAVVTLLVPLRATYALPTVRLDDYHLGELLAPGVLWLEQGRAPVTETVLPRGLLANVLPQLLNSLVLDGAAVTLGYAGPLVLVLVGGVALTVLRTWMSLGVAVAAVAVMLAWNASIEGDLLVGALGMWAVTLVLVRRRNAVAGGAAAAVLTVSIAVYPLLGLAMTGVVLGTVGARLIHECARRDIGGLAALARFVAGAGAVGLVVAVSPVAPLVTQAVRYVLVNAGSNAHSWGIPIDGVWAQEPFGWGQVLHTAFVVAVPAMLVLAWPQRHVLRRPADDAWPRTALLAIPVVVVVGLFARFMGRIDITPWPPRSSLGVVLVLGLVVPATVALSRVPGARAVTRTSLAVAAVVSLAILPVGQGGLLGAATAGLHAPARWTTADAVAEIPRLGLGTSDPKYVQSLLDIARVERRLPVSAPVLDVSNRGALSAYLSWDTPSPYLAAHNIESATAEAELLGHLRADPPPYVFLGPRLVFDQLPFSLRNPELSAWLLEEYTPFSCGKTFWATPGRGDAWSGPGQLVCPEEPAEVPVDAALQVWSWTLGPDSLAMLPASWGADVDLVRNRAPAAVTISPDAPGDVRITFTDPAVELLVLDLSCTAGGGAARYPWTSDPRTATIWWSVPTGLEAYALAQLEVGTGRLVVPLGSYPSWVLRPPDDRTVVLSLPEAGCEGTWSVEASSGTR